MNILSNKSERSGYPELAARLSLIPQAIADIHVTMYACDRETFTTEQIADQRANQTITAYTTSPEGVTNNTKQGTVVENLTRARTAQEARAYVADAHTNPSAQLAVQYTYNTTPLKRPTPNAESNYNWQQAEAARTNVKDAYANQGLPASAGYRYDDPLTMTPEVQTTASNNQTAGGQPDVHEYDLMGYEDTQPPTRGQL